MNTKRLFTLSFIIVALIALGSINALATPEEGIEVSFIDVGQGDSALISDASGFDVLIDGGNPQHVVPNKNSCIQRKFY